MVIQNLNLYVLTAILLRIFTLGSICKDCMVTVFCPLCAAIQIDTELDRQGL